jgi:hypothetical protein
MGLYLPSPAKSGRGTGGKKKKNMVTLTSREAYRTHKALPAQVEQVARFILARSLAGQRTWDRLIYRETGMLPNAVSARRNDIEKMGVIRLDGVDYRLRDDGTATDPITRKRVQTYSLTLAGDAPQLTLF